MYIQRAERAECAAIRTGQSATSVLSNLGINITTTTTTITITICLLLF